MVGCDIHPYMEIKINGIWYFFSRPNWYRNYTFFGAIANVRDEDIGGPEPKGLPHDLSSVLASIANEDGDDHSHSYMSLEEFDDAIQLMDDYLVPKTKEDKKWISKSQEQFKKESEEFWDIHRLPFIEDVRIVFWFDN